jgi:putative ABC transport system substrate-binding protein
MKTRRWFIGSTVSSAVLPVGTPLAQPRRRLPRVAVVHMAIPAAEIVGNDPISPYTRTFVHALRDLGLVDGRDIVIERRSAEGRFDRLPALMQEIVARDVAVIVTVGPGVWEAQRATDRIPIIGLVDDALSEGLVGSLARPGRNLTGYGGNFTGFIGKQLQLLQEAVPATARVAVIAGISSPLPAGRWRDELNAAARKLRLQVVLWLAPESLEAAFAAIVRERADALFIANTASNFPHLRRIADFAERERLPTICGMREFADAGGLLAYGFSLLDGYRHAAGYVKRLLSGAKPADLPFEQPTKFELVINLKTAKALGLTIPQSFLLRADDVIQ